MSVGWRETCCVSRSCWLCHVAHSLTWTAKLNRANLCGLRSVMAPPIGHNMSQTGDGNSMGGESGRGGNVGHTGTGCYKNHEHSMLHGPQPPAAAAAAANRHHRRPSVAAAAGAVSIAAVTALLTSSPATNAAGHQPTQPSNNLVDLGKSLIHARKKKRKRLSLMIV